MKRLISTALALVVFGGASAASAAPHGWNHGPMGHREVVRFAPRAHHWVRGERFMPSYGRYSLVDNWGMYRLRAPAVGLHWVRVGPDFLLVSNRTGRIVDVVYG